MDRKHSILSFICPCEMYSIKCLDFHCTECTCHRIIIWERFIHGRPLTSNDVFFIYLCGNLGWAHMTSESMDFLFTSFCAFFCGFSPWTSTIAYCFLLRREIEKLLILKIRSIRRKSLLTTKVPWTKNLYFRNKASMLFEDNFWSQMKCILLVSFLVQWILLYGNLSYSI